jgi:HK97 family phage major capsid protein
MAATATTKRCTGPCGLELDLEEFSPKGEGQRHAQCKSCRAASARKRVSVKREEPTYTPERNYSFFADIAYPSMNPGAAERLRRHAEETRDVTTGDPGAGGLVPPGWLTDYAPLARAPRAFANLVPALPLPESGTDFKVPRVSTGASVDVQNPQNSAVSETDVDTDTITRSVVTIAGQQDMSKQSLMRSMPGLDLVIFEDLMEGYSEGLDSQLLTGSGSNGQHQGIRGVTGKIDVTYTDGTPSGAELLPNIYKAVSLVATQRKRMPTAIVAHPRRIAWLASELSSSTYPLLSLGCRSDDDEERIPLVADPNVPTNLGAGTNEDEIYVVHADSFRLAEGTFLLRSQNVGSGTGTVRLQFYAYSLFVPDRYPKAIAVIGGTGLAAPAGF